ncbi:hypothetical protein QAD02_013606 [Eretmocerus hayati]|uniref:Uncharacterized protein n=1 Tax=Eretmocerus hayati TaxID=131215 RepID=A0ACC2P3C6_9HYME|nr:hypothetical protein QAD02_013606 [Eretmocerus hayati]
MKEDYVDNCDLKYLNPADRSQIKPLTQITLDRVVSRELEKLNQDDQTKVLQESQDIMTQMCSKFLERYDPTIDYLLRLKFTEPESALDAHFHVDEYRSLRTLCEELPGLTRSEDGSLIGKIDDEWARLPSASLPEEIRLESRPDVFWHKISLIRDTANQLLFQNVSEFALECLTFPNSSAKPERVWSDYSWQVTDRRSLLYNETKRGIALS